MKNTTKIATRAAVGALLLSAAIGCRHTTETMNSVASNSTTSSGIRATMPIKGSPAPVTVKGKPAPGAPIKAPVKMTASQNLGLTILKALNADKSMSGHSISVGTNNTTVTLNGKVHSAAQSQTAERIARQHAKGYKVLNSLTIAP